MSSELNPSTTRIRDVAHVLQVSAQKLGPATTVRQLQALLLVAEANEADRQITRGDIEASFGGTTADGTVSKMLRGMMHRKMQRKGGLAKTIYGIRCQDDRRRVALHLTERGRQIVQEIL